MKIKVRSKRLKGELKRRREEFSKLLAAALTVPPELFWVLLQEHGTGTHGGKGFYEIRPRNAPFLSWVSQVGQNAGKRIYVDMVKNHPGVPASHFIANSLEEIRSTVAAVLVEAMVESNYDYDAVKDAFLNIGMVEVQRIIAEAMAQTLTGTRDDGKLAGQTAADVFNQNAHIQDRSEEG